MKELNKIYKKRFSSKELLQKRKIWSILCRFYFQKFIKPHDTVLDLASGYGWFINNIKANKKIALDIRPEISPHLKQDVELVISDAREIRLANNSVDKIFISNFFEHLDNTDDVITVLQECYRILNRKGKIIIIQPNIYYIKEKYWFFIDHKIPITHKSLAEALNIAGFRIKLLKKKFLPYTTKSKIPKLLFLVWIYLKIPFFHMIFGKQSLIVAFK